MCLPASAIATPISRCRKFGAAMLTAWTRGSAATSRQSRVVEANPNCAAASSARPGTSSATETSSGRSGQLREVVRHAGVRLGVHPAHPAEPDDGDTERTCL